VELDYSALRRELAVVRPNIAEYACITFLLHEPEDPLPGGILGYAIRYGEFVCDCLYLSEWSNQSMAPQHATSADIHDAFMKEFVYEDEYILWGGCPCDECTRDRAQSAH
jgi:hypothetical protein